MLYQGDYFVDEYILSGKKSKTFKKPTNAAHAYDIKNNGVRIFRFPDSMAGTLKAIAETALLFGAEATHGVPSILANLNVQWLKDYVNVDMKKRAITDVEVDESLIHSGDFIGIVRLDGLDPMLAWGMGS